MARHIHIYLPARVRDTAPAPAKHPPAAVSELVERLMQAIADRSGKKTTDAGFDESKVKRDEGGKFSAQQHSAAAQEHKQAEQHHYNQAVSTSGSESLAHSAAWAAHRGAASYHKLAAAQLGAGNTSAERTANMAHEASTNAIGKTPGGAQSEAFAHSPGNKTPAGMEGPGSGSSHPYAVSADPKPKPAPAASDKPTKSTAKGKAGAHELLSSGHPFSVDELMAATGVTNRTTMLTALSDLKNPKYAGSKGALNIVKRADGSYHVQKSDAPAPAAKTQSKNPGGFNTSQPDPKAAKPVAHASATGQSFLPKVKTSQVNTNTKAVR